MADSRVLATARHIHICLRVAVLRDSSHFRGFRTPARASPSATPLRFGGYRLSAAKQAAHGILGHWANGTCVRLSLRGKARLLPRAASTVRSAILRRRNTASLSRLRPVAHHASQSLAVPLRMLLTRVALTRPSIRRVFLRSPCARRRPVDSLNLIPNKTAAFTQSTNWESRHLGGASRTAKDIP